MTAFELAVVGAVIGANNFAVALALGALGQAPRRWRIAAVFGIFEFTIPLIGLLIGMAVSDLVAAGGRWLGAALLAALGLVTVRLAGYDAAEDERLARRITSWYGLVGLAAGLSVDNLIVGFALGLGTVEPLLLATTIAAFAICFTLLGLELGRSGRRHWETPTEVAAGLTLVGLAVAIAFGWID